jgi:tetratricopeptide (TPR) repeat protein
MSRRYFFPMGRPLSLQAIRRGVSQLALRGGAALLVSAGSVACGTTTNGDTIDLGEIAPSALDDAREAVRQKPNDARALARLGAILVSEGAPLSPEMSEGARLLGRAASIAPNEPEIARWQGRALLGSGRAVEAQRAFGRALDADPEFRDRYESEFEPAIVAALDARLQRDKRASKDLSDAAARLSTGAVKRAPEAAAALYEAVGDFRAGAGRSADAIVAFERARAARDAANRASPELGLKHARALLAVRRLDEARVQLDAWIADGPAEELTARRRRAAALCEERFAFELADDFLRAATPTGDQADHTLTLARARVLFKAKKTDEATALLKSLLAAAPDASVLSEVGALAVTFGAPALAADAFVAAVAANPNDVGLWKVAARALVTAGDRSKLEARLGLPASHAAWAEVYLELNEPEKAVSALEAARKDGQDVSLRLARALHLTGDPKRRDEVVADFVKRAPARGKALAEAASFYDGIGDSARALVTFRDAVSESPTDGVLALGYAKQLRAARDFAGEKKVLETWASSASGADARVRAWVEVAAYWSRERKGPEAAAALDQALAQGDVPSRRAALLAAAEVHHQLVRDAARAEQLYRNWIDAAPDAERDDARRTVIDKLQTEAPVGTPAVGPRDPSFQRLRTRLLEELVSSPNSDSALLLELGEAYLELRPPQREAAERTFGRYVDSAPDRQAALIRVGNRLEEANAFAEAARTYARLEPGELSSAEDRLSVAMVLLRTQDWRRAQSFLAAYLDAVEKPPASARDPLFRAAAQFLNAGAPEFSVRLYRVLLRIDPNKTAVLRPLGDALLATGDVGGAEEVLRAYIDASGGSFNAVVSAGDAFRQRRAYAKAREVYESVFDARSRTRLSRLFPVLFETYARLNDLDSMRKLALEYVKLTPNPRAYADAARRLRDAGLLRDAYDLYGQAISAQPGSSAFREQRMAIAFQMGDASAVETASRDYVASERTEGAWVKVASLHANRGDTTSARRVLEDARKAGIDGAELQLELGRLALADAARAAATDSGAASARPSQEAIVSAFSAALAFPDSVDAVLPKIRKLLSDAGELGALSAVLREVIALYPTRHETWFELGDIAAARGRLEEARSLWERFTERDSRGAFLVAGRLWREGDASSARRYFERALDNPTVENPADVLESLVSVLLTMGQNDRVPPLLTRVTSSAGGVADLSKIAPMLESAGFVDEAARAYEELLEQRPVAEGWYRLGLLRLLLDQDAAARAAFERFLEAEPGQRERAVSSDRGKRALLRLQRLVGVTAALDAAGLEDMALEFMRREEAALPELAAVHLLSARLRLATGDISGGMASIGAMLDAPVQAGLDEGTVGALLDQIAALGRSPEALEVFRVSASERQGSAGLALAVASLAIRSGDTGAAQAELRKLIAEPSGEARFRAGRLLLEAGLDSEASEVWLSGLDAGQGLSAVDGLLRAVFGLALRNGDDGLVNDAERRVRELVEETREYHRIVALAFSSSGHYARAAEAAAAWVGALSDVPPADGLLAADPPHPMRVLIEAHLKAGNPNAAISAIDEWASESSAPAAVFTASAALLIEALHPEAAAQVLDRAMALEPASMTLRVSRLEALLDADVAASDTPAGPIATAANQITARYPDLSATTARIADGLSSRAFVQTATAVRDASSLPLSLDHLSALVDDTCSRGGDCGTWSPETTKRWEADAARFVRESPDGAFASVQLCALALGRAHFPSAMLERLAADANAKRPDAPHPVALLAGAVASLARGDDTAALASLDTVLDLGGVELPAVLDPRRRASGPHSARTLAAGLFMARAVGSGRFEAAHRALERAVKSAGTIDGRLAAADAVRDALERYPGTPAAESRRLAAAALALVDPLRLRGAQYVALTSLVSDLWEKQSDLPTAEFVYRQALERFPASPALHNNLAYFLARHGEKLEDALSLVRRAHALAPERTLAYVDTEAWILHRLGRNGDAKVLLEEALRLATKQDGSGLSEGYYHLGVVEDALGNADESVRALKLAIRYDRGGQFGRSAAALLEKKGK